MKNKNWCPLTGNIPYRINVHGTDDLYLDAIERARKLWNKDNIELRHPDGYIMAGMCFTQKDIERAQRLFSAWGKMRQGDDGNYFYFNLEMLCGVDEHNRTDYLDIIKSKFNEDFSVSQILSVIVIYEAMESLKQLQETGRGEILPLELLKILEDYNPHTLRGKKIMDNVRKGWEARAIQVMKERGEIWEDWQNRADEIWKRNPRLSKLEIAKKIRKTLQGETDNFYPLPSAHTIRQKIKKQ